MTDSDWLNPFSTVDALRLAIEPTSAPVTTAPDLTPAQHAESRARIEAKVAKALAAMRRHQSKVAAASDPGAPLMALFAAHETAVADAAAAARQSLAIRQATWRMGRALDGQPVG